VRPFDPRLLRYAKTTRRFLVTAGLLGILQAALAIALAWFIAVVVSAVFLDESSLADETTAVLGLIVVAVLRPLVGYAQETASARTAAQVKAELSTQIVVKLAEIGPSGTATSRSSRVLVLLTSGLDALDDYFARYLPQLVYSTIVPIVVLAALFVADPLSGAVVIVTLPLIPIFMMLIGWRTQVEQRRQWEALQVLSGHFLDVLRGLATLKIFGRSERQAESIAEVSRRYRVRTVKVLRISFLSSFALELLATLSVAVVAVEVGLRLVEGGIALKTALFVLVLAPEAYMPLRQVGAHFHASQAGLAAAEEAFELLERPSPVALDDRIDLSTRALTLEDVRVRYPDRDADALGLSLTIQPREVIALVGPSGGGKSTALACLLGVTAPTSGVVSAGDATNAAAWRDQIAWMPQNPAFIRGTIADNVRLVAPDATDAEVRRALELAGADFVNELSDGVDCQLGERGEGLSVGQLQRVALARVFIRRTPLVVLDEPTASLDGATERLVASAVGELASERGVVLVAHRPALADLADRTVAVRPPWQGPADG
jgi:ATP-binding cassette subfamily C protein CydCD